MKIDPFVQICRNYLAVDVFPEYRFHETRKWRFEKGKKTYLQA